MSKARSSVHVAIESSDVEAMILRNVRLVGAQRGILAVGAFLLSKVATYPPQDPNSGYRRTGDLGRRWTMRSRAGGLVVTIGNNSSYVDKVQGLEQLPYFETVGWPTPWSVVDKNHATIGRLLNMHVEQDL